MVEQSKLVYDTLTGMQIQYSVVEHPPAATTEEADKFIEGMEGVRTKTLFLCNKKNTAYYLLVMDGAKRLDIKKLEGLISDKKIRFCSPEQLMGKMGLTPGAVSLFGLLNNAEKDINVLLDREMLSERLISFHPNDNTKTMFITMGDMYRFIGEFGYEYRVLDL
ncbi:MAG: prolyl-tRNA synthetase associated domain-containing protein [Clostridiales bacterium]|nr:prolyl-tRNA synthetase associated domain-containing protein [Clostridiales bacterium]MCL1982515.1 prolyl-tRNA synthetase associated domain-containing protein [Clostridiales bacterium]